MGVTVMGDWLAYPVNKCTCYGGDAHHGHEPGCGYEPLATISEVRAALSAAGYDVTLRDPCRCGCGKRRGDHPCPCGCGHTYEEAVSNVMRGPMYLNWEQASANIDEHPGVPCKWT